MKLRIDDQTIAAISTAVGNSGVAVIRVSGKQSKDIALKLTKKKQLTARKALFCRLYDHSGRRELDRGLVLFFKGPASFTGEDTVEFQLHGSYFLAKLFLAEILKSGAQLAPPGEFTRRAFMNGKIDLTQAEAVSEMITADSEKALEMALGHLEGNISRQIKLHREGILQTISEIEAAIDYPDDINEPDQKDLLKKLTKISKELQTLSDSFSHGKMVKEGVKIVLAGKPNVGKSSLMNLLLKDNRAIVTDIPGTTRDFLEEKITLNGVIAVLADTAGLHNTRNKVEKIGIEQSKKQIEQADLCLLIVDPQQGIDQKDKDIFELIKDKPHIVVINKKDLKKKLEVPWQTPIVNICSTNGDGEQELIEQVIKIIEIDNIDPGKNIYLSSLRQKQNIDQALNALDTALETLQDNYLDLVTVPLRQSLEELSYVTREAVSDEIMETIWANFCVGK